MNKKFHLDIITPTSINTFEDVSYIRAPGLDGLLGIQANHANAIIALGIGEIKIDINGKTLYFSTSGGYTDIQSKGVQLLLETIEYSNDINMAFNLGGALADISWLEDGDVPIVSFQCENDPYAPIDTGDVIVPTTGVGSINVIQIVSEQPAPSVTVTQ